MGRIVFKKIIVHSLDNKKSNGLRISYFILEDYTKIERQLVKHIQRSQMHDNRKIASFKGEKNIVSSCCEEIFSDDSIDIFITKSQSIAEHLYTSMPKTASPANLIICTYLEDDERKIALLKMDFNEVFSPIEEEINGKLKIELKLIEKSLPSKNEKLQKCVFISENIFTHDSDNKNIIILDKQRGKEVSDFFSNSFLSCQLINTDDQNASNFIHEFIHFLNDEYFNDSSNKDRYRTRLKDILLNYSEENISVPDIIGQLYNEQERNRVIEKIGEKRNFDFEFTLNKEYVKARFQKKKYEINNGMVIMGEERAFEGGAFKVSNPDEDGNVNIVIKGVKYKIVDSI